MIGWKCTCYFIIAFIAAILVGCASAPAPITALAPTATGEEPSVQPTTARTEQTPDMQALATQVLPTPEHYPTAEVNPALPASLPVTRTVDLPYTSQQKLDIYCPISAGSWPIVVVFHGRGDAKWSVGDLSKAIAGLGAVVFAPNLKTKAPQTGSDIKLGFEQAACAVRYARMHAPEYGAGSKRVILVGYSAGGMLGTITTLGGDEFHGDCLVLEGSALADAMVDLDGVFDPFPFIPEAVCQASPADCLKIDPVTYLKNKPVRQGVRFVLLVSSYESAERHVQAFRDALEEAGYPFSLAQIPGKDHSDLEGALPEIVSAVAGVLQR